MSGLMKLREDHAVLTRMFRRLGEIIARPGAPDRVELYDLRRDIASTLLAHLKFEDWALYPQLIDSGDSQASRAGQMFKDEMGGLAPVFIAYSEKWHAGAITADWAGYCEETRGILDALMNRLTRENRELLPLLEQVERAA